MATQYKKKVKPGALELDPCEPMLIIHIETQIVDTSRVDEHGNEVVVQVKPGQKRVKLKAFNASSDARKYADEIVKQVKYINPRKIDVVVELLEQLRQRQAGGGGGDWAPNLYQQQQQQPLPAPASLQPQSQPPQQYQQQHYTMQQQQQQQQPVAAYLSPSSRGVPSLTPLAAEHAEMIQQTQEMARAQVQARLQQEAAERARVEEERRQHAEAEAAARADVERRARAEQAERQRQLAVEAEAEQGRLQRERLENEQRAQRQKYALEQERQQQQQWQARGGGDTMAISSTSSPNRQQQQQQQHRHDQQPPQSERARASKHNDDQMARAFQQQMQLIPPFGDEQQHHPQHQHQQQQQQQQQQQRGSGSGGAYDGRRSKSPILPNRSPRSPIAMAADDGMQALALDDGNRNRGQSARSMRKSKRKKVAKASMRKVESYRALLYEESTADKLKGCQMILQLVQEPSNLEHFVQDDTLLGALSRILAEDRKKSTELATTILEIFFTFSSFKQLHDILLRNRIGDTTMRIIELELKRYAHQEKDKRATDEAMTAAYRHFLAKQEKLLYVCFYILLNLAEDLKIEVKMTARNINEQLVRMLKRDDSGQSAADSIDVDAHQLQQPSHQQQQQQQEASTFLDELHLLVVTFLKKLSVFGANKNEMAKCDIVDHLQAFFYRRDADLRVAVMCLVYNLTFDSDLRRRISNANLIPFFVHAIRAPQARTTALRVLYNLSTDLDTREAFCESMRPAVATLVNLMLACGSKYVDDDMVALAVNLSTDPLCCAQMCGSDGERLQQLVKRVHRSMDPNLMKLIRNISEHDESAAWCGRPFFGRYLHQFVGMMVKTTLVEFLVEVTACLSNIQLPDYMYSELINHHRLLPFILKNMVPGFVDDDVILEMVVLLGTVTIDPLAAPVLANPRLIALIYELLNEKHDDEDMMVQLTFTTMKLLLYDETRQCVTSHEHLPDLLLDLVMDANKDVRRYANIGLDIIMGCDEVWRDKIREKRFEMCNREWLDAITGGALNVPLGVMDGDTDDNSLSASGGIGGTSGGGFGDSDDFGYHQQHSYRR